MVKIFCLYFEGKYTPDYVDKLYNSIKRNCKVDTHFVCYSDTAVKCDELIFLPKDSKVKQHWFKLQFFDKEFTGDGDIIVMDIDQVIISDITEMVTYPIKDNQLITYHKWWGGDEIRINGGWYKFKAGALQEVWEKFKQDPEKWQLHYFINGTVHYRYFGEQNFVYDTCIENNIDVETMPGQWITKYTNDPDNNNKLNRQYIKEFNEMYMYLGDEFNSNIKIVHFANPHNSIHLHEDNDGIRDNLRKNWR
jgi:hypothetical protein